MMSGGWAFSARLAFIAQTPSAVCESLGSSLYIPLSKFSLDILDGSSRQGQDKHGLRRGVVKNV